MAHIVGDAGAEREKTAAELERTEKLATTVADHELREAYRQRADRLRNEIEILDKASSPTIEKSPGTRALEEAVDQYLAWHESAIRHLDRLSGRPSAMPAASPPPPTEPTDAQKAAMYRRLADASADREMRSVYLDKAAELEAPTETAVEVLGRAAHFEELAEKAASPSDTALFRQAADTERQKLDTRPDPEQHVRQAAELEKQAVLASSTAEASSLRARADEQRQIAAMLRERRSG
jgi:hypothetical protein